MNPNDDPETLERRSEAIRADVGETLDELQRNFSPAALVDRSMNLLRDHGGDMATNVLETVRRNPVPALLIATGAAWMIAAQFRSSRDDGYSAAAAPAQPSPPTGEAYGPMDEMPADTDGAGVGGAQESAQTAAENATGTVKEGARRMKERARGVVQSARQKSRTAGEDMARLLREQPLAVGAAGILAGALIGALLPETAQENRLLGTARDRAMRKARTAGEQGFETVRGKVNDAMDRATESLRTGGSTPAS